MKILLHTCCAPCSIFPVERLREEDFDVTGFYFKSNIHPYSECLKRQEALEEYSTQINLKVIYEDTYNLEGFLQKMIFRENDRCLICYHERLSAAARIAKKGKFDCFSTTLLYSKFQKHDQIRQIGDSLAASTGVPFYYEDYRIGWKKGIEVSKQLNLYRQQYCGCIYSEKERFYSSRNRNR